MFIVSRLVVIAAQINMLVFHKNNEENLYNMMYVMIFYLLWDISSKIDEINKAS